MKCDVCGEKIPLGKYECDNCGYHVPTKRVSSFNTASDTHEHIESTDSQQPRKEQFTSKILTQSQLKKEEFQEYAKNPKKGFESLKKQEVPKIGKAFGVLLSIAVFLGFLVPIITTTINSINRNNKSANFTFQEAIDEEIDDGTAQIALDLKNEVIDTFHKYGITDLDINEYCEENEGGIYANVRISGSLDKITYEVMASYNDSKPVSKKLLIQGESQISVADEFKGNQDIVSGFGKALEVDNIVKSIDYIRNLIGRSHDRRSSILEYRSTDPDIYIIERRTNQDLTYHYSITYEEYM